MTTDLAILRVLLVRHGLSEDNQNAIWAGHRDSPLTPVGTNQAKALGVALANFSFVAIYSSDLKRASSTAEQILAANRSNPPPPLVQTQSLREQNFGQAEGRSWSDGEYANAAALQSDDARLFRFPEGESLDDVNARMGIALRRYVLPRLEALRSGQERNEPQIIIVSHGIAIAEILRVLMSMHDKKSDNGPWPDPMQTYKRVRLENTGWTLVELAVPVSDADSVSPLPNKTSVYVRIVQQNVTDHLRASSSTTAPTTAAKAGSAVGSLLAGGAGNASTTPSGDGKSESISPSLATLNLRTVNTYDARQLMRELERAGASSSILNKASGGKEGSQLSSSVAGAGGNTSLSGSGPLSLINTNLPSSSSIPTLASNTLTSPSTTIASAPGAWSEVWQAICVQVLPLFNKEESRVNIELINSNVSEHIRRSLERSPARALDALSRDLYAVCAAGMFSLNVKLEAVSNDEVGLLESFVDVWKTFHWRTLPWLEACFLPLQMDPTLISLSRQGEEKTSSQLRTDLIDIWRTALTVFRDQLIIPRFERLFNLFLRIHELETDHLRRLAAGETKTRSSDDVDNPNGDVEECRQLYPRLSQMNSILCGVQTNDDNQTAMEGVERALRAGRERVGDESALNADTSTASTSARGLKRAQARQGWLPKSTSKNGVDSSGVGEEASERDFYSTSTPAGNERAILNALRSPTIDDEVEERGIGGGLLSSSNGTALGGMASRVPESSSTLSSERSERAQQQDARTTKTPKFVDDDVFTAAATQGGARDTVDSSAEFESFRQDDDDEVIEQHRSDADL